MFQYDFPGSRTEALGRPGNRNNPQYRYNGVPHGAATRLLPVLAALLLSSIVCGQQSSVAGVRKIRDIVIYEDSLFFSSFPSVVKKKDGTLFLAFRRAPERRVLGEAYTNHVDPNSYLVALTSKNGVSWSREPALIYANPLGGSQDPCLLQLADGTLLCASYGWAFLKEEAKMKLKKPVFNAASATFLGGYVLRSADGGKSWQAPVYPPPVPDELNYSPYGNRIPAYNRGAMYEGKGGRIFWVVTASDRLPNNKKTSNYLYISDDKGRSWRLQGVVAKDESISFNETSVYETPRGEIVAFLRTAGLDDEACIARSSDGGKTFRWEKMGFKGHPFHALRLPDNRVLITYGYRHKPYGVRARILNADCSDYKTAPEIVLRTDGGSTDLGYPWSVQLDKKRVLVVYYYNTQNGPRHIAGSIMEIVPQRKTP
ncbi:sialidase family protein [Niabella drilacis]|uniref:BNR repeat-like domain-containing protein n=1 Tax=Niabella drilacis (strain DSM 25811 / CCM 8410 / CCUG 62505 / LMG 26954 / E90) TaxID=1285928 RepID=A0A1G6J2J3_NIADE|nr:sialidase family protein [Niabella drilacis]SDC12869.1 BNR repeat-like domain-containing protein [Niabella drilacis]